ncbi:hypothetical protein CAEBREN_21022 [Caenorhabditis brenneri]|uniref:Chromo domain-containing protein n=1 Tax=Caenorhabditis brenneri TaxID=135651 RepID=G0P7C7_CAEBE|nr:hypothetical protein CAEBREN_21022 [Caenorhabditis brenneri]
MADQTTEELWEVEEILDKRSVKGEVEYLMKWADFNSKYNSWEPVKNFNKKLIAEYEESRKNQAQGVGAAPNAPTAQAAAPIMIPAVGPVRPVAAPACAPGAAPAADPANENDIVTGGFLVGREITEILGMGLADIETKIINFNTHNLFYSEYE